jgi:hypothetical protein
MHPESTQMRGINIWISHCGGDVATSFLRHTPVTEHECLFKRHGRYTSGL